MTCDLTTPIFTDEARAIAHMEADRWPDGAYCPHCGSVNVHKMAGQTQAGMFLCNDCRDKFTVRTGTVFNTPEGWLNRGTTYYWRVKAEDENGNWSDWSEVFSFTTR